ncbi:hypothetical protein, partial [Dictyobacter arantiisoli]|uniref:hypothetical protein n=1 Tax=Dictyobacter arantiisoli TaxID=2014874 RepID=UPI001C0E9D2E
MRPKAAPEQASARGSWPSTRENLSENLQGGNAITLLKANERTSQAQQGLIGTRALLPADQQT